MPANSRHTFKPRGKIEANDEQLAYNSLVKNQSPKNIQEFIVSNFQGQGNTDIRPDSADIQNVRYLLALSMTSKDPVSSFFNVCLAYFQRSNDIYKQRLSLLEQEAKSKQLM